MAKGHLGPVLRYLRRVIGDGTDESGDLLERFVSRRDECAFAGLVERYGPMVFNVCQRVLGDPHDAEDAFQAAFLVLARKARTIRRPGALGGWLYRVAYHLAVEARAKAAKRRTVENEAPTPDPAEPEAESAWREARPVLDEELQRLPDKYLAPIRLHYLEGKTTEQAARELGCPKGTLLSRLDRARDLLRQRLARRGVGVSSATLGIVLAENAASAAPLPELLEATAPAAVSYAAGQTAGLAPEVVGLAEKALRRMFVAKVRMLAGTAAAVLLLAGSAGLLLYRSLAEGPALPQWAAGLADARPEPFSVAEKGTIDAMPTGATLSRDGRYLALQVTDPGRQRNVDGLMVPETSFRIVDLATLKTVYSTPAPPGVGGMAFGGGGGTMGLQVGPGGKFLVVPGWQMEKFFGGGNPFGGADGGFGGGGGGFGLPGFGGTFPNADFIVWDVEQKKARFKLPETTCAAELTADGATLVTLTSSGDVKVLDVVTGKERSACRTGLNAGAFGLPLFVLAPDGKTLAIGCVDEQMKPFLRLWDLAAKRPLPGQPELSLTTWSAAALAFAPDGKLLAAASGPDVKLWDVTAGKELDSLPGKEGATVSGVQFSPDGGSLIASTYTINGFAGLGGVPRGERVRGEGARASQGEIIVWSTATRQERFRLSAGNTRGMMIVGLAVSPDGRVLARVDLTGGREVGSPIEYQIRLHDMADGKELAVLPDQSGIIGFAPQGKDACLLLTMPVPKPAQEAQGGVGFPAAGYGGGGADWRIQVWELRGGKLARRPEIAP